MSARPAATEEENLLPSRTEDRHAPKEVSSWPIARVIIGCIIFATANFVFLPSLLFSARVRICASVYERHPDLVAPPKTPCELPAIERELASFDAINVTLIQVVKILATSYLLPILSRSRRTAAMLCVLSGLINVSPWIFLPIGYPYGPKAAEMLIGPTVQLYVLVGLTFVSSLLGRDMLGIMLFQALAIDASSPETRSRNLTWINSSIMFALCFAPALGSILIAILPAIHAGGFLQASLALLASSGEHTNVVPFVGAAVLYLATAAWMTFVVPESAVHSSAVNDLKQHASDQPEAKDVISFTSLRVFLPRHTLFSSSNERKDWRLLRLALAAHGQSAGMSGLTSLVFYCGYFLHWGPVAIGLLLSWIGLVRAFVLLVACPLALLACERSIARPALIRGLDKEQLLDLAEQDPIVEELAAEAASSAHDVRSPHTAEGLRRSTYRAGERDSAHEFAENLSRPRSEAPLPRDEDVHYRSLQRRALSLWRAKADLIIVKGSFVSDCLGWIITAIGAQYLTSASIIVGGVLVSFGAASPPTLTSTAIAIVNEQEEQVLDSKAAAAELHAPDAETPEEDATFRLHLRKELKQKQADAVIGGLSIVDQFGILWSGPINNLIYSSTLSTFPGASFLFCAFLFATSILAMWGVEMDANVPTASEQEAEADDGSNRINVATPVPRAT